MGFKAADELEERHIVSPRRSHSLSRSWTDSSADLDFRQPDDSYSPREPGPREGYSAGGGSGYSERSPDLEYSDRHGLRPSSSYDEYGLSASSSYEEYHSGDFASGGTPDRGHSREEQHAQYTLERAESFSRSSSKQRGGASPRADVNSTENLRRSVSTSEERRTPTERPLAERDLSYNESTDEIVW